MGIFQSEIKQNLIKTAPTLYGKQIETKTNAKILQINEH